MQITNYDSRCPNSAKWKYAGVVGGIINTTETTILSGVAGKVPVITNLQIKNASAVASEYVIRDGVGGTIIFRGHLSASMLNCDEINFDCDLVGTSGNALTLTVLTTATVTYVNAQGYSYNATGNMFDNNI